MHRLTGAGDVFVAVAVFIFVIVVLSWSEGRQCFYDVAKVKVNEEKNTHPTNFIRLIWHYVFAYQRLHAFCVVFVSNFAHTKTNDEFSSLRTPYVSLARKKSGSKQSCCAFFTRTLHLPHTHALNCGKGPGLDDIQCLKLQWISSKHAAYVQRSQYQVKSMCTTWHTVAALHIIRSASVFLPVLLKFLSFVYFMAETESNTCTHGKKMFNVLVLAHIASRQYSVHLRENTEQFFVSELHEKSGMLQLVGSIWP